MHHNLERIRRALSHGYCVPVIGAGVSIPSGADSWRTHLAALAKGLDQAFAKLAQDRNADPTELATLLRAERRRRRMNPVPVHLPAPGNLHRALAAWRCPLYLTTNFDDGLERALRDQGMNARVLANDQLDELDLDDCFRSDPSEFRPRVVKLCSSLRNPNPGAETREDFARLIAGESAALELLTTLLRSCTVVFVGCGMGDPLINAGIDRCFASKLGSPSPIAIVPSDMAPERKTSLQLRNVLLTELDPADKTAALGRFLEECRSSSDGPHRLLVFEPGTTEKLQQLLNAIGSLRHEGIASIGVISANPTLIEMARRWCAGQHPPVQISGFAVRDVSKTSEVIDVVLNSSLIWTALTSPYEYATLDAATFAKEYSGRLNNYLRFHSVDAALLSRRKAWFKSFLASRFAQDDHISPVLFQEIDVTSEDVASTILERVLQTTPAQRSPQIVIKPVDAAGSRGVRQLNSDDRAQCLREVDDLRRVLREMPLQSETSNCDTSRILVEERLCGEEFSIECRRSGEHIEMLAAHWKVDIDGDASRFFERIFVTLPEKHEVASVLDIANRRLLDAMKVGSGVFHAEYRMSEDLQRAHPLEVGLRPGGGMVNYSVKAARGVDLYEAAIRCSLGIPANPVKSSSIVATGLVFATNIDGGVLPSLRYVEEEHQLTVVRGDTDSIRERLQRRIDSVDRKLAGRRLREVLSRRNALCLDVGASFSEERSRGLRAKVDFVDVWMEPGSIVREEEAAYVAGLRIVAAPELVATEAMAEAIAAMRICLDSLKCELEPPLQAFSWPVSGREESRPEWWQASQNSTFRSEIDSWTFSRAIQNLLPDEIGSALDLGCGSAKPAVPLIQSGVRYAGVDVEKGTVPQARANLARAANNATYEFVTADVVENGWIEALRTRAPQWDAVVANLPYLPGPVGTLHRDVDGGNDGLRYVPDRVLEIADQVSATRVVINVSSLCNLMDFASRVDSRGYRVVRVVATLAPLEDYAQSVLNYLESSEFSRVFGAGDDRRQIIYAFTLARGQGISVATTIRQVDLALKPDSNSLSTTIEGVASW
jgi:hypothetical protein